VQDIYPSALIVVGIGPMLEGKKLQVARRYILAAIATVGGAAGSSLLEFESQVCTAAEDTPMVS
jgi:hypothetical protein